MVGAFDAVRRAIADAQLRFRVEETVHLSILQFAKFPLWKDLDDSWRELTHNALVRHLIETPKEQFVDPVTDVPDVDLDALGTAVPVPADSSQLRAVSDAVGGRTFVLEGPPGTGKSQTITNLMAHALASGRRVLFVAEKRAALDVVKKRLEAVGLGGLSLDLHDKSARPATVRAQIKDALELRISHDPQLLKTNLQAAEASRATLARYATRLHEVNAAGQSLYTARGDELAADQDVPPLEVPRALVASGTPETFDVVGQVLRSLPAKVDLARPRQGHPWSFFDIPTCSGRNAGEIHTAAVEFDSALDDAQRQGLTLDQLSLAPDASGLALWAQLANGPRFGLDAVDAISTEQGRTQRQAIMQRLDHLASTKPPWLATANTAAIDLDMQAIHAQAVAADESGFFGRKKQRRAVLAQLTDVLTVDPDAINLKELSALTKDIVTTHKAVEDLRARVADLPVTLFDRPWNPLDDADAHHVRDQLATMERIGNALSANTADPFVAQLREYYRATPQGTLTHHLARLAAAWQRLAAVTGVAPTQQQPWAGDGSFMSQWWATRSDRRLETTATIERWVDLVTHLEPLRPAGLTSARSQILSGSVVAEDASLAFDRGTAIASIAERLDASALSDFDVTAHGKTIQTLHRQFGCDPRGAPPVDPRPAAE